MADDEKTRKARGPNALGPTGERVRANLERLRAARGGMSYRDLSARLEEIGRPIPPLGLSRIEKGDRRVDADDLVALALVLNVSPVTLLMPDDWSDEPIRLVPEVELPSSFAWSWAIGRRPADPFEPLPPREQGEGYADAERMYHRREREYEEQTFPIEMYKVADHPANRAAAVVHAQTAMLLQVVRGSEEAYAQRLSNVKTWLTRLETEIAQIEVERLAFVEGASDGPGMD